MRAFFDGEETEVRAGMMLAVPTGVGVRVVSATDDLTLSAVGIAQATFSSLSQSPQTDSPFCTSAVSLLHPTPAEQEAANCALSLLWIFARREATQSEAMADFLRAVVRTFREVAERMAAGLVESTKRGPEIFRMFLHYVAQYALTERRVEVYADWLYITRGHLTKMVRQESGEPPSVHIDRVVVEEAKRLMRDGKKTPTQIYKELHFKNYSTFCNTFKRVEGVPPTEWRAESESVGGVRAYVKEGAN